ncbi:MULTISPECIES: hypothetical protein [unclassified Vibrio]|uniref:Uncharacterized protein n=1 Tax=Vibrio sp. HB236076 TaxID=3232307 RepID=A0AB39H9D4_9VIBR|nr:hypothetical protein [Vibrio sp. HB161653]MDP5254121.1 hypothetical protein [Vibrio sp. HB161653]
MPSTSDAKDKKEARRIALILLVLIAVLAFCLYMVLPSLVEFNQQYFASGLGIKAAVIPAFITTLVVFILFALVAGDGLLGELQYLLSGFLAFFLPIWLLIAWVF